MNTNEIKDNFGRKLSYLKSTLEHLNVQLHLGIDEAKDEFENQKKSLTTWIGSLDDLAKKGEKISKEKSERLKLSLEELKTQAKQGKAETEEALNTQQENISQKISKLKKDFQEIYNKSETEIIEKLDDFHARFDLFKLHTHLAKKDADDNWNSKKKELSTQLNDFKSTLEQNKDLASDKVDHFSKEIAATWMHLQNAFKYKKFK